MMTDWELLQRWVAEGSREALGEVVRRHMDMVYATARREVADEHLAEDITQAVFLVMMRRAKHIGPKVSVGGWLFKVTRFAAADARKSWARRRRLEQEVAQMKPTATEEGTSELWSQIAPALNEAIANLREVDRNVVIMKYLEGKSHAEVAAALGGTENRVRQQLFRALKKLRDALAHRGIVAEDVTLTNALESRAHRPTPTVFESQMMLLILNPGSFPATVEALSQGTLNMMTRAKLIYAALTTAAVVTLATGGLFVGQAISGETPTPANTATAPAAVATSAPAATTIPAAMAEEDKIREVLLRAWKAHEEGNVDGFVQAFDQPNEEDSKRMAAATHVVAAAAALEKQFKESYKEDLPAYMSRQMRFGMDVAAAEKNATATINGDGETAMVNLGNMGPGAFEMVKVKGEWKISIEVYKRFGMEVAELTEVQKVLDKIREEIKSGKLATSKDAEAALIQAWMSAREGRREGQ